MFTFTFIMKLSQQEVGRSEFKVRSFYLSTRLNEFLPFKFVKSW